MTYNRLIPAKKKGRFSSPYETSTNESFLLGTVPSFLQSLWYNRKNRIPESDELNAMIHDSDPIFHRPNYCTITWIGHSTFLICYKGITFITDPVFGDVTWLYRRILPPGLTAGQLPTIDYIVLSHNHRDHMDASSLYALKKRGYGSLYVPEGDKKWFDKREFERVFEFSWWEETAHSNTAHHNVRCTFLPAVHWSQRGLFDKNRSLWGSWMIDIDDIRIYFAGDTAYSTHFSDIGDRFSSIDVVLMPIGPCEPHHWMRRTHVNPQEAVQGFNDLGGTYFVPMHWGTFLFGTDHIKDPYVRLCGSWDSLVDKVSTKTLSFLKIGETLNIASKRCMVNL